MSANRSNPPHLLGLMCMILATSLLALCSRTARAEEQAGISALRKTLLDGDLSDPSGLRIPPEDPRGQAIDKLAQIGSSDAVAALETYLTTYGASRKLKQRALVALGRIATNVELGEDETKRAVEAIKRFEAWAERVRLDPPPFKFGKRDHGSDHFAPNELKPLATAKDPPGGEWAVFRWGRYRNPQTELWITRAQDKETWSSPMLIDLPDLPKIEDPAGIGLKAGDDRFVLTIDDRKFEFSLEQLRRDTDKDGLYDSVEKALRSDPSKRDTDGDGIEDGKDGNPLTPTKPKKLDETAEIRQAVFTVLFATCNSLDTLVLVDKGDFAKQEYYGYGGVVLKAPKIRQGCVNVTWIKAMVIPPDTATATISDWEGNEAGSSHFAKLRKIHGKWVVVEFMMTSIS